MAGSKRRRSSVLKAENCKRSFIDTDDDTVGNEQEETANHALSVDLILKEIFKNLQVPDLLSCSLVNKLWCSNARSVLRDQKVCTARLRGKRLCEILKNLNDLLQNCSNIPFNGFSVHLNNLRHTCAPITLDESSFSLVSEVKVKHVKINYAENPSCPVNQFLKTVLETKSCCLERLTFTFLPSSNGDAFHENIFGNLTENLSLPSLKVLEFPTSRYNYPFEKLIDAAPALKKIFGRLGSEFLNLLAQKNKLNLVKGFVFEPTEWVNDVVQNSMICEAKLEKLKVNFPGSVTNPGFLKLNASVLRLIESSHDSLTELEIYQLDLFLLSVYGSTTTLENVNKLVIYCDPNVEKKSRFTKLNHVNYSRLFPRLTAVELRGKKVLHSKELALIRDKFREMPGKFLCETVMDLDIKLDFCHDCPFPSLGQIFPNVKNLRVSHGHNMSLLCYSIWTAWTGLESVTFCDTIDFHLRDNQDAVFCGIFEEEALEWQSSRLDLTKLQYAPIKPCLSTLLELKKLRIEILHTYRCQKYPISPDSIFLSRLTGELTFCRMPNTDVEVVTKKCGDLCGFRMDHLRPYARVVESVS